MKSHYQPDGVLPVTPAPIDLEPLLGYVLRTSERNGYETPWHVFDFAGIEQGAMIRTTLAAEPLARILAQPIDVVRRLPWGPQIYGDPPLDTQSRKPFLRMVDLRHPKICPECVAEHGRVEAAWDLKLMIACPVHRKTLVDRCPACDQPLRWFRPGLRRCRCGADIAPAGETIPTAVTELLMLVRNRLYGRPAEMESEVGMPLQDLAALSSLELVYLLRGLKNILCDRSENDPVTLGDLETLTAFLADWPHGVHRELRRIQGLEREGSKSLSVRQQFGRLTSMLKSSEIPADKLTFLNRALATFGTVGWNGAVTDTRILNRLEIAPAEVRVGSLSRLARRVGVDRRTARDWVDRGIVPSRIAQRGRSQLEIFELTDDLPVKESTGALSVRDAGKYLGLPVSVLQALRRRNIYKVERIGVTRSQYHRLDLDALRSGFLEKAANQLPDLAAGMITLRELMRRKLRNKGAKAEILAAIWEGRLAPCGRLGDGIGDIVVNEVAANGLTTDFRLRENGSIPAYKAAAMIGCDPVVIPVLFEQGHLAGCRKGREYLIEEEALRRFCENYRPVAALAKERGTSSRALTRRLAARGVELLVVTRPGSHAPQAFLPMPDGIVASLDRLT